MFRQFCKKNGTLNICLRTTLALSASGFLLFGGAMLSAGYYLGAQSSQADSPEPAPAADDGAVAALQVWMNNERDLLATVQRKAEDDVDALAMRVARLQAQMMRIDALGERLVKLADLDADEFDFSTPPATGGPDDPEAEHPQSATDLLNGMDTLDRVLQQRAEQLTVLEEWLMNNEVRRQTVPSGLPVEFGWISSSFGRRINPVTGKRQHHVGVDIPGDAGDEVLAVAAGVVTRSERVGGYGNIVELRHADGYSTRYAHNKKNLVAEGDRVEKGQAVALLGSTGRTTGPHVHFEVRKDGDPVDPEPFLEHVD